MAQLQSPGVSVTVIDESFYTPSAPGTVPLIIVASEESKPNGAGTGIAPGTLKSNAGQVYLLTSQKDVSDIFGTPIFQTDASNNPIHAGELNEYGLQAAYSFLGVSNSAYVVRADIDLQQLTESTQTPAGLPVDGTTWIDTTDTKYGVFQWNSAPGSTLGGQTFTVQKPSVITDATLLDDVTGGPLLSFGTIGSYAIVATTSLIILWFKKPATTPVSSIQWVDVGGPEWIASWPTVQSAAISSLLSSASITISGTEFTGHTSIATLVTAINTAAITGITAGTTNNTLCLYSTGVNVVISAATTVFSITNGTYLPPAVTITPHTAIPTYKKTDHLTSPAVIAVNGNPTGSIWVKASAPNAGAHWIVNRYSANTNMWSPVSAPLYASNLTALQALDKSGGGINLPINTLYVKYNDSSETVNSQTIQDGTINSPIYADFKLYRRAAVGSTTITSQAITTGVGGLFDNSITTTHTFAISESVIGQATFNTPTSLSFTVYADDAASVIAHSIAQAIAGAGLINTIATVIGRTQVVISHLTGGDLLFTDVVGTPIGTIFPISIIGTNITTANFYQAPSDEANTYIASNWSAKSSDNVTSFAIPSAAAPTTLTANGELWYDGTIEDIDILIHNGTNWVGYLDTTAITINNNGISNAKPTDSHGPIISASKPTTQYNGSPLANNDLWISTADLEKYPLIYKFNFTTQKWVLVDNADQTTENGIIFHDVRWTTGPADPATENSLPSSIQSLLTSNFVDFDTPDPALYPKGMLLWNLRRSGFNVKRFVQNYVNTLDTNTIYDNVTMTYYYPHRWVSDAANQADGSGSFGRIAQRTVVLQAMTALINANQQIRDEDSKLFNLLSAPGYPELITPLVNLNYDRGLTAFVVGDSPARLTPDATTLSNWGQNVNNALNNGDQGLVTTDPYLGVFYPWGYSTDNIGNNIVVPPSHIMLRTIALSDNVSYPWFAPAGVRRGGITNASAVGYVDSIGEFHSVALNNGQRDTLANIHVNPLTYISGTGLVNYGQKTRQLVASALDRINVARLVVYLRVQLARIAKPYIFEPNDTITRNEIKQQIESFLLELVGQRAIYDFLIVCDKSNNFASRIDRNELYVDIAIEPVKAIEFIYIPLRLENTGAIAKLGK